MDIKTKREQRLCGARVLVVEDEFFIAVTIEEALRDAGAEIVSAATLSDALKGVSDEPLSMAVLDFRLGRESTESVADMLAARAVPFVFYSGDGLPSHMREKHPDARVLLKPMRQDAFVDAVVETIRE